MRWRLFTLQKHGIDFSTAIEEEKTPPEHGENRVRTIGLLGSSLLVLTVI
jgi:uncharacterized DUF497 family protein